MSEINRTSLVASRARGPRNDPDSMDLRPVEATPDGRLKIDMAISAGVQRLGSAAIAQASATSVFAADANQAFRNVKIKLCNNEGIADHTVKVYHVPSGGSPANANMIDRVLCKAGWSGVEIDLAGIGQSESIQAQVVDATSDLDVTVTVYGERYV